MELRGIGGNEVEIGARAFKEVVVVTESIILSTHSPVTTPLPLGS